MSNGYNDYKQDMEWFQRKITKEIDICYYGLCNGVPNDDAIIYFACEFLKEDPVMNEDKSLTLVFEGSYKGQSDYTITLELGEWLAYNGYCFYPMTEKQIM